jgi:hypothetical protein
MKILLVAMPDTVRALDAILKIPDLDLCSLAGNLRAMIRSRLWRYHPALIPPLLSNNVRFAIEGWRNRLFASRHSW